MIIKRKKHTSRHCKDCKQFDGIYCLISYTRHDPMTKRCKDYYDPKAPFYLQGRFWLCLLLGGIMIAGIVVKLTQ